MTYVVPPSPALPCANSTWPQYKHYIDEYDRQRYTATFAHCLPSPIDNLTQTHRLSEMPEIEREEVIAQRLEELQRITDRRNLDQKAAKRTFPSYPVLH